MNPLFIAFVVLPVSLVAGACVGLFVRGVPMRGWVALSLLFFSASIWMLGQPRDSSVDARAWALPCFAFIAPVAVIYSFRARKLAPDRTLSRAAFIGSFLIAAALLCVLVALISALSLLISSPHFTLAPFAPTPAP